MHRCHACRRELSEESLAGGRCVECGAVQPVVARRRVARGDSELEQFDAPKSTVRLGEALSTNPEHMDLSGTNPVMPFDAPQPKAPTIDDRCDATVDFGAVDPDKPTELRLTNPQGAAPGGDTEVLRGDAANEGEHRETQQMGEFAIDFGGDDPDLGAHMTNEWASIMSFDVRPSQTIRQSGTVNEFIARNTRSTLPIKSRTVRQRDADDSDMTPLPYGDVPDYELLEMIGKGGMGVVYAAHQSSIARTVALKMLRPGRKVNDEQRDKFISEAVVTGELDHPNIVPIYDLGASEEGALFYSMKRVRGTPWDEVLLKKSLDENLNILLRVADAVAFAHASGVVHRDLKPENVMLGDYGEVLVMDWGLARVTTSFRNADTIYQVDSLGGTPAYMSPEMARGPVEGIDHRSDIYLLGAILYEIISGNPPHSGKDVMQCLMAAANNRIDPVEKRGELVDIALRAMATDPEERHQTVKQLQAAVQAYQSHSESLVLTDSAAQHLQNADQDDDYTQFARALYGCQEALTLWQENHKAADLLGRVQVAYAGSALAKEDFDLGLSVLSGDTPQQQKLIGQLERGKQDREARLRRLRLTRRIAAGAVAAFVLSLVVATLLIKQSERAAIVAKNKETLARQDAEKSAEAEKKAKQQEAQQRREAERQKEVAEAARAEALTQKAAADSAREVALDAEKKAVDAKLAEEKEAYIARIGLASAKIDENAFDSARQILTECKPALRNWEWGRLHYLVGLSPQAYPHHDEVESVEYSPDGQSFAAGDWGGCVIVRRSRDGQETHRLQLGSYVHSVSYSPSGRQLAAGCADGLIRLVDLPNNQVSAGFLAHEGGVLSVAFSPDGQRLLSAGFDNTARLWRAASHTEIQALEGHGWWVCDAQFSPDAGQIVTASQEGRVIVWAYNKAEAQYEELKRFDQHEGPVYAAKFSPNGEYVASAGYDNLIRVWRPDGVQEADIAARLLNQEEAPTPATELAGHRAPIRAVAFSADGKRLLSASLDNTLRLWDAASGRCIKTLRGHGSAVRSCDFSLDGRWAISACQDKRVRLWDVAGYEEARVLRGRVMDDHSDAVLAAQFSHAGDRVITASRDRSAKLWDAKTGSLLRTFREGHEFLASTAVLFDKGQRLATGAGDDSVRVWDVAAGTELFSLRPTGRAATLAVSSDGLLYSTGGPGNEARVWSAQGGGEPAVLAGHEDQVTAATFSPHDQVLATGDNRGVVRLWRHDAGRWTATAAMRGHSRTITGLRFAKENLLISASGDNTCGQWDTTTGQEDARLVLKHGNWVSSLELSRDARLAITTCQDGVARVWRLADARLLASVRCPKNRRLPAPKDNEQAPTFTSASFSPDSEVALLASSDNRTVSVWNWRTDARERVALDFGSKGGAL
ncbi:MAG: protein kinase [Planctomycetales bacterium]|nr:protein kinase [Planctomycetales bacterium]